MTIRSVYVDAYRPWRSWFRRRYRNTCEVCGDRSKGHLSFKAGVDAAWRHLAWHELVDRILFEWTREG